MPAAHCAGGAEGRADAAVRLGQRLEVVHVLRRGLAGARARAPGPKCRTNAPVVIVDLDDAARQRACSLAAPIMVTSARPRDIP